jgi:hypothetical protein
MGLAKASANAGSAARAADVVRGQRQRQSVTSKERGIGGLGWRGMRSKPGFNRQVRAV